MGLDQKLKAHNGDLCFSSRTLLIYLYSAMQRKKRDPAAAIITTLRQGLEEAYVSM